MQINIVFLSLLMVHEVSFAFYFYNVHGFVFICTRGSIEKFEMHFIVVSDVVCTSGTMSKTIVVVFVIK